MAEEKKREANLCLLSPAKESGGPPVNCGECLERKTERKTGQVRFAPINEPVPFSCPEGRETGNSTGLPYPYLEQRLELQENLMTRGTLAIREL